MRRSARPLGRWSRVSGAPTRSRARSGGPAVAKFRTIRKASNVVWSTIRCVVNDQQWALAPQGRRCDHAFSRRTEAASGGAGPEAFPRPASSSTTRESSSDAGIAGNVKCRHNGFPSSAPTGEPAAFCRCRVHRRAGRDPARARARSASGAGSIPGSAGPRSPPGSPSRQTAEPPGRSAPRTTDTPDFCGGARQDRGSSTTGMGQTGCQNHIDG